MASSRAHANSTPLSSAPRGASRRSLTLNIGSSFFLNNWFYIWVFRLIRLARSFKDLPKVVRLRLPDDITSSRNGKLLEESWKKELEQCATANDKAKSKSKSKSTHIPASSSSDASAADSSTSASHRQPSILRALMRTYKTHYLLLGIYKLLWAAFTWTGTSLILFMILKTLRNKDNLIPDTTTDKPDSLDTTALHLWAFGLFLSAFLSSISIHQLYGECAKEGYRVKAALTVLVYRKSLVLARVKGGAGEVINIVSSDISRVQDAVLNFHFLWTSAIETLLILGISFYLVEEAAFSTLIIVALLIPIQIFLGILTARIQREATEITTQRVHIMSELLTAIKLIKFYAWENPFSEKISAIRQREIILLRRALLIKAVNFVFVFAAPLVIALAAFVWYTKDPNRDFAPSTAFTVLSVFNTLRYPLLMLPQSVKSITGARVSLARLTSFMTQPEVKPIVPLLPPPPSSPISSSKSPNDDSNGPAPTASPAPAPAPATLTPEIYRPLALELHNATFTWEGETQPTLFDISLSVKQGQVVAVIGDVGAGKSSLIAALLGQMRQTSGEPLKVYGHTSYVPQEAWMLNFTLRENITFGTDFDESRYRTTIHVCALERDLTLFAAGDLTEIAERGANLSGGQRQRASLARAVYANSDIVLLDDPLSAVDQAVGRHIFDKCIRTHLSDRAVVMVTHQLQYLPEVDYILHFANGRIIRSGTYSDLMARDADFAALISNHVAAAAAETDPDAEADENMPLNPTVDNHVTVPITRDNDASDVEMETSSSGAALALVKSPTHSIAPIFGLEDVAVDGAAGAGGIDNGFSIVGPSIELNQTTVRSLKNLQINQNTISSMLERDQLAVIRNDNHSHDIAAVIRRNELTIHSISEMELYAHHVASVDDEALARKILGINEKNDADAIEDFRNNAANSALQLTELENDNINKNEEQVRGQLVGEDTSTQSSGWGNYFIYAKLGFGRLIALLIVALFFLVHSIRVTSDIYLAQWIKVSSDNKTKPISEQESESTYAIVYLIFAASFFIGVLLRGTLFSLEAMHKARILHDRMFYRILRAPMAFFDATPLGRILSAFAKHLFHVDETMPDSLLQALQYIPLTVGAIIMVSIYATYSYISTLVLIVIGILLVLWATPAENNLKGAEAATKPPIFSHLAVTLEGLFSIRAYGAEKRFDQMNLDKLDANHELGLSLSLLKSWTAFYLDVLIGFAIYFVALLITLCASQVSNTTTRASNAGVALSNVLQILVFLQWSIRNIGEFQEQVSSVGIINYYSTKVRQEAPSESTPANKPPAHWPREGVIDFQDVVLKYHDFGVAVLKNVSFKINAREKVGIVGRTGSGKSTLLVSLLRIVELTQGKIQIDGIDISKIGLRDLREQVAIIPQEPVLFVGTIRSNLDPFSKRTDEEVWKALKSVHLADPVNAFPLKLDAPVVENGKNFSLGQRQLFCIARAILSKTKILVLDEATAAIDMQTDALIQTAIKENFADLTVLTIAHRLNTIIESDKVLVMEAGRVVEFDEPLALLNNHKDGHFASLVNNTGEATAKKLYSFAQAAHDARQVNAKSSLSE